MRLLKKLRYNTKKDDEIRLRHILDAAQEITGYVATSSRSDLESNRMLLHSLVRLLEIIGEAANQVSVETQAKFPQVPWQDIVAMRNRLIHGYFDINKNIVWNTCTNQIPPLRDQILKHFGDIA